MGLEKLQLPLIQGGMGIGVSLGNLAGHVAKAGAMGVISTANPGYKKPNFWQSPEEANTAALREEIAKAKEISQGSGLVAVNAMVATSDYENMVKTALKAGVDAVISGAGLPMKLPELAKGFSALLAPIVSGGKAAAIICRAWMKRYRRTPDFLVLEGSMAGGHLGFPLEELESGETKPLSQLLAEVKEAVAPYGDIPVFVAGGVFDSKDIVNYINQGAAGVQIATRFIATEECDGSEGFKQVLLQAKEPPVITKSPVGMPGRALNTPLVQRVAAGKTSRPQKCVNCLVPCKPGETPYCITKALIDAVEGDYENGLFFASENAARINEKTTVQQLMDQLMQDWRNQ